ncbi:MAG: Organic solvent tolerance protein [Bryobacterales bacterium]|nr:Organic solvent tolerance protein [Bryobacterales bacterium]
MVVAGYLTPGTKLAAQTYRPTLPPPEISVQPGPNPNLAIRPPRPTAPGPGEVAKTSADQQELDGTWAHLRGNARIETADSLLTADEIDYNRETHQAEARGKVRFESFTHGEKLSCDRAEYNTESRTGKFYKVSGTSPARVEARRGLLTTQNPFYFSGEWAEKLEDRYILHDGFLTDCLIPNPWWRLKAPTFDVIPEDRAIARSSWFYVKEVPIFYTPVFYKSLQKQPRRSGFLTPNVGNSSLRGKTVGFGYFWAINRSYDLTYRGLFYSQAGVGHQADFRGAVNQNTGFDISLYGIASGSTNSNSPSGLVLSAEGKSELGKGWQARGELRYLSSFAFRQQFTQSFDEAVSSETHSVGFVTRHWSDFGFNLVAQRNVNFQTADPNDQIVLRKLPEVQFITREHPLGKLPVWISLDSSYGLERRSQLLFQTRQFVQRVDFAPRIMTALHWRGFDLAPSFGVHEIAYDSSINNNHVTGDNVQNFARDVSVDLSLPALSRIFDSPKWMGRGKGARVKHVIEPRATYRYVNGIEDFNRVIRFDDTDILSNTHEVEFSVTNRLLSKDSNGNVSEVLSWQLWYKRYLDPTFGGAVIPGQRNVLESTVDLTGIPFLDGPRHQSPVVSVLRYQSNLNLEWRSDYDPVRGGLIDSGASVDRRIKQLFVSVGDYLLKSNPLLAAPGSNQLRGQITYGGDNRRGWNYGFSAFYDNRLGVLQFAQSQITYNSDCCGFSVQYRRFSFGTRNENQFRVAFAVSNIGSVGTLRKQDRIF